MHKLTVQYTEPNDVPNFLAHYRNTHLPIVERWPNLRGIRLTTFTGTPRGEQPQVYLQGEFLFDSPQDLQEALASEASRESARDLQTMMEEFEVHAHMLIGEEHDKDALPHG